MRLLLGLLLCISSAYAADCISIQDSLDREYCFKKEMRKNEKARAAIINKYKGGISQADKNANLAAAKANLARKQAHIEFLKQELASLKAHEAKVAALKVHVPKKKRRKKKKKKDILSQLGIKL